MCRVQADLDALFPDSTVKSTVSLAEQSSLPSIPGYEVEAVLGSGGMGVVFRARHLRLNRSVALKMALAGEYAGPNERERFQREAEAVAGLRHVNIVQVYDVGDVAGRPYFTMELVEGGSLGSKLAGEPQPANSAAALVGTLAGAVHAAHLAGIAHRDLKPANILLAADGTPKVSDFGLARRLDGEAGLTRTGLAVGTPSYMAPEQARGQADAAGPAADVYGLGAVLYELLTGRPPFRAESAAETLRQVIDHDPVPPSRLNPAVPRDLETVCLKCLHKDPRGRYPTAAALQEDLNRFIRGEAVTAQPEGLLRRAWRRVGRRPMLSAALAGVAFLAAGLLGVAMWVVAARAAVVQAAEDDLGEMARWQGAAAWPEARAALDRAKTRLNGGGPLAIRDRVSRANQDLALVERLDAIRLASAWSTGGELAVARADADYESAFSETGIGRVHDDIVTVADRVSSSAVRPALINALDDWAWRLTNPARRDWLLRVVRRADHDVTGWRESARNPAVWADVRVLTRVVAVAPVADPHVPLFLSLAERLNAAPARLEFLRRVQFSHPTDFWVNLRLGDVGRDAGQHHDAVRYYQAAVTVRPTAAVAHNNLGMTLTQVGRHDDGVRHLREAARLDPTASPVHNNLAMVLTALHRHDEALAQIEAGLAINSTSPHLHSLRGGNLEAMHAPELALTAHRHAVACDPAHPGAQEGLRNCLIRQGHTDEARIAWAAALAVNSDNHIAWYGYAELCAYLDCEADYSNARRNLLARFHQTTSPHIAERVSRACLLRPAVGNELRQAVSLAERAAASDRAQAQGAYPHFQFARGLAEYRQGQYDRAAATMRGDAARALGPAPGLVLALSLYRSGETAAARQALAVAIAGHDWRPSRVYNQDGWICHSLRRDAEAVILPTLAAFLAKTHQPKDNDERLALLGVCQFTGRTLTTARLYADAFAADPKLPNDIVAGHRFNAARAATLAGVGNGTDATDLTDQGKENWRGQGRQWLRAELAACQRTFEADPAARHSVRQALGRWREANESGGLRDPAITKRLPPSEQSELEAIWAEAAQLYQRAGG
jgi:eukaryotic-like serine/threonine-protein kinase